MVRVSQEIWLQQLDCHIFVIKVARYLHSLMSFRTMRTKVTWVHGNSWTWTNGSKEKGRKRHWIISPRNWWHRWTWNVSRWKELPLKASATQNYTSDWVLCSFWVTVRFWKHDKFASYRQEVSALDVFFTIIARILQQFCEWKCAWAVLLSDVINDFLMNPMFIYCFLNDIWVPPSSSLNYWLRWIFPLSTNIFPASSTAATLIFRPFDVPKSAFLLHRVQIRANITAASLMTSLEVDPWINSSAERQHIACF